MYVLFLLPAPGALSRDCCAGRREVAKPRHDLLHEVFTERRVLPRAGPYTVLMLAKCG